MPTPPTPSNRIARRAVTLLVAVLIIAAPWPAAAQAPTGEGTGPRCRTTQLGAPTPPRLMGSRVSPLSVSADGRWTVFDWYTTLTGGIYLHDATTGQTRKLTRGAADSLGSIISGDGTQITTTSARDIDGALDRMDSYQVYTSDAAAPAFDQATDTSPWSSTATGMSADGRHLLYVMAQYFSLGVLGGPIRVQDLDTGQETTVVDDPGGLPSADLAGTRISPDGTKVVFTSNYDLPDDQPRNWSNVYLYDLDTTTMTRVTAFAQNLQSAASRGFTDHGATVVFDSDEQLVAEIPPGTMRTYLYDIATATTTPLTDRAPGIPLGAPSPDGTRVLYRSNTDPFGTNPEHTDQLFTYDTTTGTTTQLTRGASRNRRFPDQLTWPVAQSTDGTTIAFNVNRNLTGTNPDDIGFGFRVTTCDPPPRPDAAIATTSAGPHTGDDVYSSIPRPTQRLTATLAPGQTATYFVNIQNERTAIDELRLRGIDTGTPGYRVRYRAGTTDITTAVRNGTYTTDTLDPDANTTIKIKITALPHAAPGSTHTVDLTAISTTNPVARDTVRAKANRG